MRQGPLAGRYPAVAAMVMFALIPYEETAAHGALLAQRAGFRPHSIAVETAPTWKGIVAVANEHEASLIVLGSHRRTGLAGHLLGSVATAVVAHSPASVLVVHQRS